MVWKSDNGKIAVARVGSMARASSKNRLADGFAVIRDGVVQYPWMQKREAVRRARALARAER